MCSWCFSSQRTGSGAFKVPFFVPTKLNILSINYHHGSPSTGFSVEPTRVLTWLVVLIAFLIVMGTLAFDFALMLTFPHLARNFDPLNPVLALGPTVVILTVVLALTFSWLNKKITYLTKGIDQVAAGNFATHLDEQKSGPLSASYQNFNQMTDQLAKTATLRDDFINQFSHEFRTPIASIQGFADLMQERELPKKERQAYLALISKEAHRLTNLSTNVLTLTTLESQTILNNQTSFDLTEQVRQTVILLWPQLKEHKLNVDLTLAPATAFGNADLLNQVWVNLINNAIKFTPDGGHLTIKIERHDDQIAVSVNNDGPLISPTDQDHLFEKFYQTDNRSNVGRLGLGLAIASRIIALHQGHITVVSNPADHTTFTVYLPSKGSAK